jgi:hypothetical protein
MPKLSIRPALGLLGLGLLLLVGVTMVTADTEPNDDQGNAEAIEASTYVGTVNMTDKLDVYEIQVVGSDIIGLSFRTLTSGTQYMEVVDTSGGTVATLESTGGVRAMVNVYIGCDLDMEWWYLEVSVGPEGSEAPGDYEFSLFYDQQDDGGAECDAPCDFAHALMLDPGEYPCEYGFHDERDVYRVLVKAGWTLGLCLECSEQAGPMRVQVYTGDDLVTPMKTEEVENERSCEWLLPAATPVGTNWYIVMEGVSDETFGEYTLRVDMDETDSGPPKIIKVTPKSFDPEKDLKVKVTIDEDTEIETATLHYRKDGKGTWKEVSLTLDGDVYSGKIGKGDLSGADKLEYYIEATDTTGFHGVLGSETDVETMKSTGESPGFGSVVVAIAMASAVLALGSRRRP